MIFFSDVPGSVVDLIIDLAYSGWVGGLALNNISQVILIGFTKKRIKTTFFPPDNFDKTPYKWSWIKI